MKARERILDAALEEFSSLGYNGATTRGIASKAKVNEVTLFRHFGTKEGLFRAVIQRDLDISEPLRDLPKFADKDPVENITTLGLFIAGQMRKRSRISKLVISDSTRVGQEEFTEHIPTHALPLLEALFEDMGARDPNIAAVTFQSFLLRSVLFEAFLGRDPIMKLDKSTIRRLAVLLVEGMGVEA